MTGREVKKYIDKYKSSFSSLNLLDDIFDGVYIVDRDRKILFWNKGAKEITGYSAGEVEGKYCRDDILNHIDEEGNLLCNSACPLLKSIKTGKRVKTKVYPLHKNGSRIPVFTHIAPIKDKNDNIIAAIEVFRDISKEEEFRMLQEKFKKLIKKYVSSATYEEVQRRIQDDNEADSSTEKDLSILYLDIKDFTVYSENHSPRQITRMLNDVFGICEVITKECYGDIDKFIGDAVMAVFIDPNDAVKAGSKILTALERLNDERIKKGKDKINVRIGINSGALIQGPIGTTDRKDLTVIGDAVNTAARIQSLSPVNTVSISELTRARLKKPDKFKFYKKTQVKGKKNPVSIYISG
ncbi:MAG: adenylate/guanylate cyclase domain-containing protein [Elusimicrobiota bacterium]